MAIGEILVFVLVPNAAGKSTFIVDSPEYGRALYIFNEREDAMAWAKRTIDRNEARRRARRVIIHTKDWEAALQAAIA